MDMKLSPLQQKLRHAARELAEAEFAAKAAEIDRTEAYPYDNVAALKAAGFMGYTIPTSHGGRGGSYFEAALIVALLGFVGTTALSKFLLRGEVIE